MMVGRFVFLIFHCVLSTNKSQYWPRGANKHAEIAENEEA